MDIVEWNEDPAVFIANALNPAQVIDVIFSENDRSCTVVVPDYQLSLAIGKRGQNARLAAKLTNYKIDIKSESDMAELLEQQAQEETVEILEDTDVPRELEVPEIDQTSDILTVDESLEVLCRRCRRIIKEANVMKTRKIPLRRCVVSNEMKPKKR